MSKDSSFKTRGRQKRVILTEGDFSKGMRFTESFLSSGSVKTLMNYRIMDNGSYITPRNGISEDSTKVRTFGAVPVLTNEKYAAPHTGFYGVYRNEDGEDTHGFIVVSFGTPTDEDYAYFKTRPGTNYFNQSIGGGSGYIILTDDAGKTHIVNSSGFAPEVRCSYYKNEPKPVFAIHDSTLYFHDRGVLSYLKLEWSLTLGVFVATVEPVVAKELELSEATSIGFNMLDSDPYDFSNKVSTLDTLIVFGVLPYDVNNPDNIRLSANTGEKIRFELFYQYFTGRKYRYKWEIAEHGAKEFIMVEDYSPDRVVTNGAPIILDITPDFNKFILRCTVAPVLELADRPAGFTIKGTYTTLDALKQAHATGVVGDAYTIATTETYVWDPFLEEWRNDTLDETIAKVGVYPVYELNVPGLKELDNSKTFNLNTATGMFTHGGMLGLWGVDRVKNTLFLSDGYDAAYFPFPQNTFSFPDEILHVESFSGSMFVFTARKLYVIEGTYVPEMYGPYVLLDNVDFERDDMRTITAVKTGLFMRMNGAFYMLLPNSYTGKVSDMRLINISSPVMDILYDFESYLKILSDQIYKMKVTWSHSTYIDNYDFINYVDSGRVRNIFRFAITEYLNSTYYRYQLDLVMVYDSDNGLWLTEVASFPYVGLMSSGTKLYSAYAKKAGASTELYLQKLSYNNSSREDTYNTMFYGVADNDKATLGRASELDQLDPTGVDTIISVIDGDTVELSILGRTRLLYVNTPESYGSPEPYGFEAKAFLQELLTEGTQVYYEFDPNSDRADVYDRALAWLRVGSAGGTLVQVLIAEQGFVKSYYDFGATLYTVAVEAKVSEAITNQVGLYKYIQPGGPYYVRTIQSTNLLANYQMLDTGNRNHDVIREKKYKEIQFLISNDSSQVLEFYADFYADSVRRNTSESWEIETELDPESSDYGTIFVTEKMEPNITVGNETQFSFWQLDLSAFPDVEVVKVVFRVNGIGHYPRFTLVSRNQAAYKILGYAWAFRSMNAR